MTRAGADARCGSGPEQARARAVRGALPLFDGLGRFGYD